MVQLPEGVELTLSELQDMAARQQQQIESQQQMLVAKEQRLKFLKQQEMHPQQSATENNERLRRLRERVEAQELKLRKLRALRGQVDQQKMNNSSLTSELESIRALFNEKEKELSLAVAKVEELTQQLEELKRGRLNNQVIGGNSSNIIELEKLRRELMYRNKLNEQQNNKLAQQREALCKGQEEMNRIDRRIAELQQRLHRKRLLNQQLANQINAAATAKQAQLRSSQIRNRLRPLSTNIAAVEPFKHTSQENQVMTQSTQPTSQDDLHPKLSTAKLEDLPEFQPNKNDPKYQTLPVNTKFLVKPNKSDGLNEDTKIDNKINESLSPAIKKAEEKQHTIPNSSAPTNIPNGKVPPTQTVHSTPAYAPPKSHATAVAQQTSQLQVSSISMSHSKQNLANLAPKPYGSSFSSSILNPSGQLTNRNSTLMGSSGSVSPANAAPKYIPPPAPPPIPSTLMPSPPSSSFRPSTSLPVTPLTTTVPEQKPSASVPNLLQQSKTPPSVGSQPRPSPIYQTSSTRITPVTPHTLNTTPQGILREVEDFSGCGINPSNGDVNSKMNQFSARKSNVPLKINDSPLSRLSVSANIPTAVDNAVQPACEHPDDLSHNSSSEQTLIVKPSLPPKPNVPQKPTPPPRQIHAPTGDKMKVDTSPDSVDLALNVLRGTQTSKANVNYKYANRNAITDTYTQKLGGSSLSRYLRNVSQSGNNEGEQDQVSSGKQNENPTLQGNEESDADNVVKKLSNDLPIKAKPLTIKKHSGVDPPKLKLLTNGNTASHRKPSPPLDNSSLNNINNNHKNNVNGSVSSDAATTITTENIHNGSNTANSSSRATSNVHVSINRRIEMPPAFLFPENETPPDLHGVGRELLSSSNTTSMDVVQADVIDNVEKIPPPPPLVPPPYPGIRTDKSWDPKVHSEPMRYLDSTKNDDHSVNENANLSSEDQGINRMQRPPTDLGEENAGDDTTLGEAVVNIQICNTDEEAFSGSNSDNQPTNAAGMVRRAQKGNLKTKGSTRNVRRVSFDPLALLLDASLEGELELVKKTAKEVPNPSAANDEGITALHNAICAGHYEIVKFLVEFGCDVNAQDSDGWTPLHCAASCNNLPMVKFLVEHGACIFATTLSDHETAAEKCEEDEEGFDGCSEYLYSIQEKLGILNNGAVYALYDYDAQNSDEIGFKDREMIIVLRKGDEFEREWWWSRIKNKEGYIPRNLLGLYPRVNPSKTQ